MNARKTVFGITLAGLACIGFFRLLAAEEKHLPVPEYVTIRWAGRENTHIIRPGGKVEFVGQELRRLSRPDRTDERAFYMNAVMNGLTKEGYEFAGISNDEIIMKKAAQ